MLGEYKVSRCSRKCWGQNRPLREGEAFYSVVIESKTGFERRDYCLDAWEGPPEGSVGHWKNRMPEAGERKLVLAPREVLIDLLRQMESAEPESTNAKIRYLLGLLLLRRRLIRLGEAARIDGDSAEENEDGLKYMHLEVPHDGSVIRVLECRISKSETESLTESLQELLYCEAGEEGNEEVATDSQSQTSAGDPAPISDE